MKQRTRQDVYSVGAKVEIFCFRLDRVLKPEFRDKNYAECLPDGTWMPHVKKRPCERAYFKLLF